MRRPGRRIMRAARTSGAWPPANCLLWHPRLTGLPGPRRVAGSGRRKKADGLAIFDARRWIDAES